jgi:hypothetical protein
VLTRLMHTWLMKASALCNYLKDGLNRLKNSLESVKNDIKLVRMYSYKRRRFARLLHYLLEHYEFVYSDFEGHVQGHVS